MEQEKSFDMKKYEITIIVDTNDGDSATQISEISKLDLDMFRPLIAAIKANNYEFETLEQQETPLHEVYPYFSEKLIDKFSDYVPTGEHGSHTIESIEICPLVKKERLL